MNWVTSLRLTPKKMTFKAARSKMESDCHYVPESIRTHVVGVCAKWHHYQF